MLPRGYGRPTITYSRVWLWYLTRNTVPRSRASLSISLSLSLSLPLPLRATSWRRKRRNAPYRSLRSTNLRVTYARVTDYTADRSYYPCLLVVSERHGSSAAVREIIILRLPIHAVRIITLIDWSYAAAMTTTRLNLWLLRGSIIRCAYTCTSRVNADRTFHDLTRCPWKNRGRRCAGRETK